MQESVEFLYTNSEMSESKNKTIPFKISLKKLKYLGINLTKLQSVGSQRVGHD